MLEQYRKRRGSVVVSVDAVIDDVVGVVDGLIQEARTRKCTKDKSDCSHLVHVSKNSESALIASS